MSDRLAELRRQRQLMQEHLAWLDREIATETGKAAPAAATPAGPAPVPPAETDADALIAQYSASPESLHQDVRKGCLLYFALASVALIALVAVLYFTITSR